MERAELERRLAALRDAVEYPRTPPIAHVVAGELSGQPAPGRSYGRRAALAAVLVSLVVTGGAFAAIPGVRDAILDLFDLRGATIETTTAPVVPPPGSARDYGRPTSLDTASRELEFAPLVPARRRAPDAVFVRPGVPGGELTLVYGELALSQFRGDLLPGYIAKLAPAGTDVERLLLNGDRAVWFTGAPHFFAYRTPDGEIREGTLRAAKRVLLVERGRLLIRVEGAATRAEALDLVRSLTRAGG